MRNTGDCGQSTSAPRQAMREYEQENFYADWWAGLPKLATHDLLSAGARIRRGHDAMSVLREIMPTCLALA
ncbi:hypothetical protein Kpho01_70140 [Kitasatospora phosalacinea]|uniref:Uncharacterized protein n=1 Tax=Kitasatospora phosalacinea TaxID=2065 RepID=A0A9W6PM95_9ACTN|nr:hypothetical protein Kpho01_70140 [Kitasatospora phosalacinea]